MLCGAFIRFNHVFIVDLPSVGTVWREFNRQVLDHCRKHQIFFHGYDTSKEPTNPTELPFVLLSVTNSRDKSGVKIHAPYDDLVASKFTAVTLVRAK